ncbi:MAG: ABC transporter ATP-binding protein, partial [Gemmataceae bacterium]
KCFFEFCQESLVGNVVNNSLCDLRNRFYRNVIHLDVGEFGEQGTSELMARFTNDMEMMGAGLKTLYGKVISEPLRALGCVIIACMVSWQLTLLFLVLIPLGGYIVTKVGRSMKRASRRLLERMSDIYKILQETFFGIRVVKAFTMEPYERRRFRTATREYYKKAMRVVNIDALAGPVIELLGMSGIVLALLAGGYLVLNKTTDIFGIRMTSYPMDYPTLLMYYALLAAVADPVRKLSSVFTKIQSAAAAADRIFALMDRQPRVMRNNQSPRLKTHDKSIEFRNICFSYDAERPILTNINLEFQAGETIALVGRNGCGKTTMLGLLPRFYDPDHGSILIDDADIRSVNLRSLRKQIAVVTQETVLFDDTIYNNIAYGNRRARREQVEAAAKQAFALEIIERLPKGFDSRVGEAGRTLSGGEKQRIALARAIVRDPRILILDEFTSQIDAESDAKIHLALREFMRGRTTFVITHRLNTLEIADRIVVLEGGQIEAAGTHAELLRASPAYQRLHDAHFQRRVA